mgnify:CR=1 FL=1
MTRFLAVLRSFNITAPAVLLFMALLAQAPHAAAVFVRVAPHGAPWEVRMPLSGRTLIEQLQERAKELHCLYRVHAICARAEAPLEEILREVVSVLPLGWEHSSQTWARIVVGSSVFEPVGAVPSPWVQSAPIRVQGEEAGRIEVYYLAPFPVADEGPFRREERKLIDTVAELLGQLVLQRQLASSLRRAEKGGAARMIVPRLRTRASART